MSPFVIQLISSAAASSILAAAIVWLSKSWISERLKNAIRHEYDQKLETHKAQLHAQSSIEMERLRAQLNISASEHAFRFERLHERRAAAIARLYSRLVESYWKASSFASPVERAGEPDKNQKFADAMNAFASFYRYFEKNKIYLPPDLCDQLEKFVSEMRTKVIGFGVYVHRDEDRMDNETSRRKLDAWMATWEYLEKEVPIARQGLENALRKILDGSAAEGG